MFYLVKSMDKSFIKLKIISFSLITSFSCNYNNFCVHWTIFPILRSILKIHHCAKYFTEIDSWTRLLFLKKSFVMLMLVFIWNVNADVTNRKSAVFFGIKLDNSVKVIVIVKVELIYVVEAVWWRSVFNLDDD